MRLFSPRPEPAAVFLGRLRRRPRGLRALARPILWGAAAGGFVVWLAAVVRLVALDNVHEVQRGRVWRAGQMAPARLDEFIERRGVRTVVNLRGCCADFDWYRHECRVTHGRNVSQEDVTLSAIRLPSPSEIRRLVEVLDNSEPPILLHCRQGVDRTGLAAVAVKLLEPGVSLNEAERQLGFLFGYVPYNGTENMQRFFALYRDWLARLGVEHAPPLFRQWATHEYCPGRCRARLEWLDAPAGPWLARSGRVLRLRVHNTSVEPWRLRPGTHQGVHARYRVSGPDTFEGRAGQFDAAVCPGESIDLELGIPPLAPGSYSLSVDLIDVDQNAFSQFGVAPLTFEFQVGR